jgi:hypothetical protein
MMKTLLWVSRVAGVLGLILAVVVVAGKASGPVSTVFAPQSSSADPAPSDRRA